MKKRILFVINTLSRAGAEKAFLELLRSIDYEAYEVSLYVLMGQGELAGLLPKEVCLRNKSYSEKSVLEKDGRRHMYRTIAAAMLRRGTAVKLFLYLAFGFAEMLKAGRLQPDKLLWRVLSDAGERFEETFDLAVAFLEGGAAYYVADHVKAKKKAAFIHIDYTGAGYTRRLDQDCYLRFDAVFPIGEDVKRSFLAVYPECADKTSVIGNIINREEIRRKAELPGGFTDDFDGIRLLTVGRLTEQKAYPVAIEALRLLKEGHPKLKVRWYVLGEGPERAKLKRQIAAAKLTEDFILEGAVENPFPWYAQADIYIHATRFEGKSIAVQEAQALGCAVIASEGSRELVEDGKDGILCRLVPEDIRDAVVWLAEHEEERRRMGRAAAERVTGSAEDLEALWQLLTETREES